MASDCDGLHLCACPQAGFLAILPRMLRFAWKILMILAVCGALGGCGAPTYGPPNLGGPTPEERTANITSEPTGDFYYGRRYFVGKTRFWGYLRRPREAWSQAKLVIMREDKKRTPDRLSESAPPGERYGYDTNFEYRIHGYFTGKEQYEPNSNQFLAEFMLTGYELLDQHPGWLFRPDDHYDPLRITIYPR